MFFDFREQWTTPQTATSQSTTQLKQFSKKEKLEQFRESWKEKTESLNLEKDSTKLTRSLNQENNTTHRGCTAIEEIGKTYTGKHAANVLAECFATDSKIAIP